MNTKTVRSALQAFLVLNGEGGSTHLLLKAKKQFDMQNFPAEVVLTESVRKGHVVVQCNSRKLECY